MGREVQKKEEKEDAFGEIKTNWKKESGRGKEGENMCVCVR